MDRAIEPVGDAEGRRSVVEPAAPVSDAERNAALAHLRRRVDADELSLEAFSDAASAVVRATTTADLVAVISQTAPTVRFTAPQRRLTQPLLLETNAGRLELKENWQLARRTEVRCGAGKVTLDLTSAEFDGDQIDLQLRCSSGKIDVVVPWGVDVQFSRMSGRSGSVSNELDSIPTLPALVHVRVDAEVTSGRITFRRSGEDTRRVPLPRRRRRWWFRHRSH